MSIHNIITDLAPITVVILFIIAGIGAWGNFKRQTLNDLKMAVEVSKDLADVARQQVEQQKSQIGALKTFQDFQEKRILRLEIDNDRKQRRILSRDRETDMLENIIRVAVSGLQPEQDGGVKAKVDQLLADLAKFRRQQQDLQDDWEQTQTVMHTYLGPDAAGVLHSPDSR